MNASERYLFEAARLLDRLRETQADAIEIGAYRCGPTSTVAGAALLQAVVCGVVEALVAEGREPEVFRSANEDGGDEANEAFLRKYRASIPML